MPLHKLCSDSDALVVIGGIGKGYLIENKGLDFWRLLEYELHINGRRKLYFQGEACPRSGPFW